MGGGDGDGTGQGQGRAEKAGLVDLLRISRRRNEWNGECLLKLSENK